MVSSTPQPAPPPAPSASIAPEPAQPCASLNPTPLDAATALLSSDLPFPELAAKLHISLDTLLDLLDSDEGEADLDLMVRLTNLRATHRQAQAKITGLAILHDIATTTEDQQERRRAATAMVRGQFTYRPPSPRASRGEVVAAATGEGGCSPSPSSLGRAACPPRRVASSLPHDHDARPTPTSPPYSASPDTAVARDLATLQSLTNPDPTTAFCAIYPTLAIPAQMDGRWNEPFKNDLANAGLLDLQGVQISQDPAIQGPPPESASKPGAIPAVHGTATATVRIHLTRPEGRITSCTFHLLGIPSGWTTPDPHPTRWHTLRIEPHDTG